MAINPYFTQGTVNEQNLIEDIIIESLKIYGKDVLYIPRTMVAEDKVFGEDRLSKFEHAYPIEMYFDNIDSFAGQGAMIQKFGLMMEQSATLTVARKRWEQLIGSQGTTHLSNRPCEGDLIYYPLTKGLFEIKFVQHQEPFYQLGKLYVYKLQVELFQYASERVNTGIPEVDVFENLKSFDVTINPDIEEASSNFGSNQQFINEGDTDVLSFDDTNPFGEVYRTNGVNSTPGFSRTTDSTSLTADQTTIKTDRTQ
jgi:hypothetical protein